MFWEVPGTFEEVPGVFGKFPGVFGKFRVCLGSSGCVSEVLGCFREVPRVFWEVPVRFRKFPGVLESCRVLGPQKNAFCDPSFAKNSDPKQKLVILDRCSIYFDFEILKMLQI